MLLVVWMQSWTAPALGSDMAALIEGDARSEAQALAETTPRDLVLASDVVVMGTILEERSLQLPMRPGHVPVWRIRVEETVTGHVENGTVDVVYREDWYSGMAGRTVLVFGRQMPVPVGSETQPPGTHVVLSDVLEPTALGGLFLYDPDRGHWSPSVATQYVPWLPAREDLTTETWSDFLDDVRDAARRSGARGHTTPGACQPSAWQDAERTPQVLRRLDHGPFQRPVRRPPVSETPSISSAALRRSVPDDPALCR